MRDMHGPRQKFLQRPVAWKIEDGTSAARDPFEGGRGKAALPFPRSPREGYAQMKQDREAEGQYRLWYLGRHPAPGWHEGFRPHRGDQLRPNAPIFDIAHFGIVGDLFPAITELVKKIEAGEWGGTLAAAKTAVPIP
jgi:hypothetical protein